MLPVMVHVFEQISSEDSKEAVEAQKGHKVKLEDPSFVLRLAFLVELSHFLSLLSKEFQRDNVFPYKAKQAECKTKQFLLKAKSSLEKKELPEIQEKTGNWTPWENFKATYEEVKSGTYKGLPLLLKGQQGHKTRKTTTNNDSLNSVVSKCLGGLCSKNELLQI